MLQHLQFRGSWNFWSISSEFLFLLFIYGVIGLSFYTSLREHAGVIFSLQFVCVCVFLFVCLSVCLSLSEQNYSRMDGPIWTRFSLDSCLPHAYLLELFWNLWPWVKGFKSQGHSDVGLMSILLHNSLLTSILWIYVVVCPIKMKFSMSLIDTCIPTGLLNLVTFGEQSRSLWGHFLHISLLYFLTDTYRVSQISEVLSM